VKVKLEATLARNNNNKTNKWRKIQGIKTLDEPGYTEVQFHSGYTHNVKIS